MICLIHDHLGRWQSGHLSRWHISRQTIQTCDSETLATSMTGFCWEEEVAEERETSRSSAKYRVFLEKEKNNRKKKGRFVQACHQPSGCVHFTCPRGDLLYWLIFLLFSLFIYVIYKNLQPMELPAWLKFLFQKEKSSKIFKKKKNQRQQQLCIWLPWGTTTKNYGDMIFFIVMSHDVTVKFFSFHALINNWLIENILLSYFGNRIIY